MDKWDPRYAGKLEPEQLGALVTTMSCGLPRPVEGGGGDLQAAALSTSWSKGLQRPVTDGGSDKVSFHASFSCQSVNNLQCSLCSKRTRL